MIEIKSLSHNYGSKKALDNINLEIRDGEIFGLIGHNGAGKSTTIKSLVNILEYTQGEILIDGVDIHQDRMSAKKKIAYVPDSPDMFLKLQAVEYWHFIGAVYNMDKASIDSEIDRLCEIFSMKDSKNDIIETFSHGMRQKTFVIGALLVNPQIWVLDEPMTGLDPQSAFNLKEMMKEHTRKGNSVLFSTHVLEVAEKLCDRIGILKEGKLIFVGNFSELKSSYDGDNLEEIYLNLVGASSQESITKEA